jgi:CzcA family heavy metal efflux pump
MMRWIIGSSLKFRRLVVAVAAGVMVLGVTQLGRSSVDVLPEFTPTTVEVQTEALGLSAAEVEQLITVPLEQDLLNGVAFLDDIESASLPGLSSVVLTFEPGTEVLDARQVVQERLTQAHALPNVSRPPQMIQPLSSTSRVSMVRLTSNELTPIEMSVLARWVIGPRLLGVDGVANVSIWGQRERQLQVLVDPERLRDRGVTLLQVIRTTGNALEVSPLSFLEASTPGTGGFIDTPNQRLQIFHEQAISTPEELGRVAIENTQDSSATGGRTLTLSDVSEVVEDHQPLIGDALCRDGQCLLLVIEKFPGANTLEVTRGVDAAFEAMRPGLAGMEIDSSIYRPATYIETAIGNLAWATLVAAILLVLLLGLFFFQWRTALIAAIVIPLSLVAAGLVLYLSHATVNTMVVTGLVMALGAVIADAVIDVGNLAQRMRRHRGDGDGAPVWRIVLEASMEMRSSALYASLIVAAMLLAAFFMTGEAGAFLPPVAIAYVLAVAASMVVALTVTPALGMMLLSDGISERRESPLVRWVQHGYDKVSSRMVRLGPAVVAFAAVAVLALAAMPFIGHSMRPSLRETDVLIHWEASPGTSLPRMNEITAQAVDQLGSLPGVRNVGAHVGRAVMSDQVVGINTGEIWVHLDPAADYDATVASIEQVVDGFPQISNDVLTYSEERITDVLHGTDDEIVVRIYGENGEVLRAKAAEIQALLSAIEGIDGAEAEFEPDEPTIEVEVDLARAQDVGVKPGDVRRAAATLLSGVVAGSLFEDQKVFDVVVWGAPEIRQSEADIQELLIDTPGDGQVRLGDVADVRVVANPSVIRHHSVSKYVDVSADVAGRDVGAVAADVERRLDEVSFPLEHRAEVLGGFADQQAAGSRVIAVALAAAIAIFLLLQATLGSWRLAILAFVALPLALVGGLLAVLFTGASITLGSVAGFVAVLGLATRGLILLIGHYQELERREGLRFGRTLVLRGTRDRLAPILMTLAAVCLVLVPFVLAGGGPGLEIVRPMAIVILGGSLTTALLTVLVVPAAYLRFGRVEHPDTTIDDLIITIPEIDTVRG